MAEYKITIKYEDDTTEEIKLTEDRKLEWVTPPKKIIASQRGSLINQILATCNWLKTNGGKSLEVEEE